MDCHHIAGAENYFTPVLSNADRITMIRLVALSFEISTPIFCQQEDSSYDIYFASG